MSMIVPDDLEQQALAAEWAVALDIAHTPVIPYTLLGEPPPMLSSGILRPVEAIPQQGGGYMLALDPARRAESIIACTAVELRLHRSRYLCYKGWLAKMLATRALGSYNARVDAISYYFDGMEPGPGMAKLMKWT